MTTPQLITLIGALGLGIPLLVGGILFVVFGTMFENLKDAKMAYKSEGIELDSKLQWVTVRLNIYASPAAPNASGQFTLTLPVDNVEIWEQALLNAGAQSNNGVTP